MELHLVLIWSLLMAALTAVYWGNLTRGRLPLELVWFPWGSIAAFNTFRWLRQVTSPHGERIDSHTV